MNEDLTTQELKLLVRDDGVLCAFPLDEAKQLLDTSKKQGE